MFNIAGEDLAWHCSHAWETLCLAAFRSHSGPVRIAPEQKQDRHWKTYIEYKMSGPVCLRAKCLSLEWLLGRDRAKNHVVGRYWPLY